ncbi:hypothetical protein ACLKA7_001329 [Drosophila subpalustris]
MIGAAEWTGSTSSGANVACPVGVGAPYHHTHHNHTHSHSHSHSTHHHHAHHLQHQVALPPPPPPPAAAPVSVGSASAMNHYSNPMGGFDATSLDMGNYHISTMLPDIHGFSADPYQTAASGCYGGTGSKSDLESISYGATPAAYNNAAAWSNGYNNYQYGSCSATAAQYGGTGGHAAAPPPPVVLYPQLYSTVNQNQIHLHLHSSEKLEQYLATDQQLTISSLAGNRSSIEIGLGTNGGVNGGVVVGEQEQQAAVAIAEQAAEGASQSYHLHHHHSHSHQETQRQLEAQQQQQQHPSDINSEAPREEDVTDLTQVWRPY